MDRDRIISAAVDIVAYRVAQSIQAAITNLEHAKIQLGYPGTVPVTEEIDGEGVSLASTMMAALADSLPISPRKAVTQASSGETLSADEIEMIIEEVCESVFDVIKGEADE